MTTRRAQPKGNVDRIAQRRDRYRRAAQKTWTCPDCGAIHRGFKLDQCRNAACDNYHTQSKEQQ